MPPVTFRTRPADYRHWRLSVDGEIATLTLDVAEDGGLVPGYELKLNSYDLGVDIELYDATQRLRFEHPEVRAVVVTSGKDNVFCAGANIRMLAGSTHAHKVNFCKFTNETRLAIEDASAHSGQRYLAAMAGTASGGGYELALACDHLLLVDDNSSAVSFPEVPLLGVLPGTGGLTRLVDKRFVRRDHADVFATKAEGIRGRAAVAWRLVDELAPRSRFAQAVAVRAAELAARSDRPTDATGIVLTDLTPTVDDDTIRYSTVEARLDRAQRAAWITIHGPENAPPADAAGIVAEGDQFWPLRWCRELDDLVLHLRSNETGIGTFVLRTEGDPALVAAYDELLLAHPTHWLAREVTLYLKRTLKRLDLSARSLLAVIDDGSCFAGSLAELAFAADRSYHLDLSAERDDGPTLTLTEMNLGPLPMGNGLTRLQSRFLGEPDSVEQLTKRLGEPLEALAALEAGLVTFAPDDIDWDDEVRLAVEERAALSPDALTGMEANHRFCGPETMETKIFARLSVWQNWIFLRPNASGLEGALRRYGSGVRPDYDHHRI